MNKLVAALSLLGLVLAATSPASAQPAPSTAPPQWTVIEFVDVPDAFGANTRLSAHVRNQGAAGLQIMLVSRGAARDPLARAAVRMHLAGGAPPIAPLAPAVSPGMASGGPGGRAPAIFNTAAMFAWQPNRMDEAWIEVVIASHETYWFEVPYGFVRDPSQPQPGPDPRGNPRYAAAMAHLGPRDHVVPFRDVAYDVGAIQHGWRLQAHVSNPFDAHVELELYRDDGGVGQSMYRWELHSPRTSVEIHEHTGARLTSLPMMIRLHDDGMRRSDHFHFNRSGPCTRAFGVLHVEVDQTTREVPIPSSLYGYVHGAADPYDAHRVVPASRVLGEWLF